MFITHDYYELANLAPGYEAGYTILDLTICIKLMHAYFNAFQNFIFKIFDLNS
jgi:hypothetical protein